ncbi:hypothetical protein FHW69_001671 [Luteibacter sp. Sphag1AF]|uniref:hypothetical protein n=1 Tax=Luteibacter sp. Sphag1AF TaxID=2587031 RepID=UPI00160BD729|nr:hypothetical protein [Luteibacter sp. Sphag1AF]MBB3227070.1 hypothetical protein [Luteibacter sp. Sphag1AF]
MAKLWLMLVLLLAASVAGCRHKPDEERVREAVAAAAAAAEAGHPADTVASLSDDFEGNHGTLDRQGLQNLLRVLRLRGQSVHALVGPIATDVRGERLVATFTVTLTAGIGVLPEQAGVWRVESAWRKEGGDWRCYSATWEKAL